MGSSTSRASTSRAKLTIRQNLHYGLGSSVAAGRELVQGHLPLLLHPDPHDVLFLGRGDGRDGRLGAGRTRRWSESSPSS